MVFMSPRNALGVPWSAAFSSKARSSTVIFFFFKILLIHERPREAATQAEGEASFTQGAQCGTPSQGPGITPGLKAGAKLLSHPDVPSTEILNPAQGVVVASEGPFVLSPGLLSLVCWLEAQKS